MKEGWTFLNFEDCIEKCKKTKQLKTSDYLPEGKYPIVSQESDLISGYTNMADYVNDFGKPIVVFGDHSRVVKYIDFAFAVGADGVKILIPTNDFHPKFFYYYLHWHGVENLGYSRHYKLLKEINVPIPTLSEQQHIVEELDLLSSIIEKKKAQLNELDNMAQSLFYEMFGDPITNEKEWKIKKLGDISNYSKTRIKAEEVSIKNYVGVDNLLQKCEGKTDAAKVPEAINHIEYIKDDVLIGNIRPYLKKIWLAKYRGGCNGDVLVIRRLPLYQNTVNPIYLFKCLSDDAFFAYDMQFSKGEKMPRGDKKEILKYPIAIPPIHLQNQFVSKIEAVEHQKELIKKSIKEVETLFNSRMDYYFN